MKKEKLCGPFITTGDGIVIKVTRKSGTALILHEKKNIYNKSGQESKKKKTEPRQLLRLLLSRKKIAKLSIYHYAHVLSTAPGFLLFKSLFFFPKNGKNQF